MVATVPVFMKLGSEFMPPLYEGSILYMPTTMPGISVTEAERLLQVQDRILKSFPEVERVFGKAGRADSSTDPAPFSMMETTVILKPENEWRARERWYSSWSPEWLASVFRHVWRDRISHDELVDEMDRALKIPGTTNAWTMPIKARIDMLSTGIRTPIGIKVFGSDLNEIERIGKEIETAVRAVPATRSAFAERVAGGYFIDFDLKRDQLARYGLTVDDANMVIMTAIGGEPITTLIKGRERYSVSLRYPRELREDLTQLERVLVPTMSGAQVPMGQLADIRLVQGPSMIRNENGLLSGYVYVDFDTGKEDVGGFVEEAKKAVAERVTLPSGYTLVWSGQFENMIRVRERLKVVIPITLVLIWLLMYMNTKSAMKTFIVLLAVPFSIIGAVWFLWILGYNMSIAVWVGDHRPHGPRRRDGRLHAPLPRPLVRRGEGEGAPPEQGRADRGDHPRRRQAGPAEGDDRLRRDARPHADHVVRRSGLRRHEEDRRSDGRRPRHVLRPRAPRLPGRSTCSGSSEACRSRTRMLPSLPRNRR